MNWQKITETIPRDAKDISQSATIDSGQVCRLWQEYAGKALMDRAMAAHEAINFRDGVLTISVTDATYLDDIRSRQNKIVRMINKALGTQTITRVNYK